jgi:mono/diheme cytochrome c family protein
MRAFAACLATAAAVALAPGAGASEDEARTLTFSVAGKVVKRLTFAEIVAACAVERVVVDDPFYQRSKSFLAFRLTDVLALGFGRPIAEFAGENFFLRALDGYAKPASAERLAEPGGRLAFADAEGARGDDPGWEPIDRRQVDPGPYYLVWTGPGQQDPHRYPWPYQLAVVDRAEFASEYPHLQPAPAGPETPAWRGYATFRRECVSCHSVNGEGGKIGPDLNIPMSIVEYRPAEQIKAYIRDPAAFRRTSMPSHPHLDDRDLDDLLEYFDAMRHRKHDPDRPDGRSESVSGARR